MDRRQPGVAGAHAVVPVVFEMIEERGDQVAVDVVDVEQGWLLAGSGGGESEQQAPGVAVSADGVVAGVALLPKPVGEERLQGWGQRGHDRPSPVRSSRSRAAASSSGAAERYQ